MKQFLLLKRIICQSNYNHYFKIGCHSQSNYNHWIFDLVIFKSKSFSFTKLSDYPTLGVTGAASNNGSYQMSALNYEKRSSVCSMTFGGSDKCARCLKAVYAAEKVFAAGKVSVTDVCLRAEMFHRHSTQTKNLESFIEFHKFWVYWSLEYRKSFW